MCERGERGEERRGGVNLEGIIQVSLFKVESESADAASVPLDTRDTKASTTTITTTGDTKASTTSSITTMQPQHIYMQTNDQFEVFTTVLSPQVHHRRHRYKHGSPTQMVVQRGYKPLWPDELELCQGEVILVLFRHEETRWYGRLQSGQQGYFPSTHVADIIQEEASGKEAGGVSIRRSSEEVVLDSEVPVSPEPVSTPGNTRRRFSLMDERPFVALRRQSSAACSSPRLLHRILSKHRRKSESHGSSNRAFEPDTTDTTD